MQEKLLLSLASHKFTYMYTCSVMVRTVRVYNAGWIEFIDNIRVPEESEDINLFDQEGEETNQADRGPR